MLNKLSMRVRIVCYEDVNAWILGKFALKMQEFLIKNGVDADISNSPSDEVDINHHIIYEQFTKSSKNIDTLMVTHIDSLPKLKKLYQSQNDYSLAICMSRDTMAKLQQFGINKDKLCFVNPAHDNDFLPKKIQIGYMSRRYSDGRKREYLLRDLFENINPDFFSFKIMGAGWDEIVELGTRKNIDIEYQSTFDLDKYKLMMSQIDYYLYTGLDEGQMGFVDALATGVKTIVTPQGYHLDVINGIDYSFDSSDELLEIFRDIYTEKLNRINSVKSWTWENYTKKHILIWQKLLNIKVQTSLLHEDYSDGLYSIGVNEDSNRNKYKLFFELLSSTLKRKFFFLIYIVRNKLFKKG